MNKKTVKLKFTGFAAYHDPHRQAYYRYLADRYELVETDRPDFILDGGQDFEHVGYDAVKILLDSENIVPDFNDYDYAIGSANLTYEDRYLRIPWFVFYPYFADIAKRATEPDEAFLKREFCSFVVSDAEFGDPVRKLFYERLSKYKPVASGGRWRNNVGGPVGDKLAFLRNYKFNIAFENSSFPGYTTEKIMEAFVAQTLPIYYGNPTIEQDFRRESMVVVKGKDDIERAVEEIVRLDRDDAAYLKKVTARCCAVDDISGYERRLEAFLSGILDRSPEEARRLCPYGYQAVNRRHLKLVHGLDQRLRNSALFKLAAAIRGRISSR